MSHLDDKKEELRQRRSDALMGIVSSRQSKDEMIETDNATDIYLFTNSANSYGILNVLKLYQEERAIEKSANYIIDSFTQGNIEGLIWADLDNVMGSSATAPRYSPNNFYYIDANYNIEINYQRNGLSIFYNNGESFGNYMTKTCSDALGTTHDTYNIPTVTVGGINPGMTAICNAIRNVQWTDQSGNPRVGRGSGVLTFWNSFNAVIGVLGGFDPEDPNTVRFDDDYKVFAWKTDNYDGTIYCYDGADEDDYEDYIKYKNNDEINTFLNALKALCNSDTSTCLLDNLINKLNQIKAARNYMDNDNTGGVYWSAMRGDVEPASSIQSAIDTFTSYKNTLNGCYGSLKNYGAVLGFAKNANSLGGTLANIRDDLNTVVNTILNINTAIESRLRVNGKDTILGQDASHGLRKWINFWLTEKISLDNGSYTSIYFLTKSIEDEIKELDEADKRLKEMLGATNYNVVPRPSILAAYSDPKVDKTTGKILQNRIGAVWDGQIHGKKYILYRKNVKAFNYYDRNNTFAFKWDNEDWPVLNQKGNAEYPIENVDPETGLIATETLKDVENDEIYILRVKEVDANNSDGSRPFDYNDENYSGITVYSKQSKMYDDENPQIYSNITNGVVKIKNHPFKRGSCVLLESNITNPAVYKENPINGFYRVVDADEDTFVLDNLINTSSGGKIYKAIGVVTARTLPYVSYDENGIPSLISRS